MNCWGMEINVSETEGEMSKEPEELVVSMFASHIPYSLYCEVYLGCSANDQTSAQRQDDSILATTPTSAGHPLISCLEHVFGCPQRKASHEEKFRSRTVSRSAEARISSLYIMHMASSAVQELPYLHSLHDAGIMLKSIRARNHGDQGRRSALKLWCCNRLGALAVIRTQLCIHMQIGMD
nr:hypothetical protein CFP56_16647 [Quercus suber]